MTLDPKAILELAAMHGIVFEYSQSPSVQEWKGSFIDCDPGCTWYSGFKIIKGVTNFALCISSIHDPEKMITLAYLEQDKAAHMVKVIKRQLETDHSRKGCRIFRRT